MKWINLEDKEPVIDKANPTHYIFINPTTYQSVLMYNGFIERWPPLLLPKHLWYWQEVNPRFPVRPPESPTLESDAVEALRWLIKIRKEKGFREEVILEDVEKYLADPDKLIQIFRSEQQSNKVK